MSTPCRPATIRPGGCSRSLPSSGPALESLRQLFGNVVLRLKDQSEQKPAPGSARSPSAARPASSDGVGGASSHAGCPARKISPTSRGHHGPAPTTRRLVACASRSSKPTPAAENGHHEQEGAITSGAVAGRRV